jgi:hypothetical protein
METTLIWKVVLAVVLLVSIFASTLVRAPGRSFPREDLRLMVVGAVSLYCVGLIASLTDHVTLGAVVFACGVTVSALAVWLSRGTDAGERPPDDEPDETPPPDGPGDPEFDWEAFEREFGVYAARREREPALNR